MGNGALAIADGNDGAIVKGKEVLVEGTIIVSKLERSIGPGVRALVGIGHACAGTRNWVGCKVWERVVVVVVENVKESDNTIVHQSCVVHPPKASTEPSPAPSPLSHRRSCVGDLPASQPYFCSTRRTLLGCGLTNLSRKWDVVRGYFLKRRVWRSVQTCRSFPFCGDWFAFAGRGESLETTWNG
jgi:hypothetical protein